MAHSTVTLSVRIPPEIQNQLDKLSDAKGRTKSFLVVEAIENYIANQAWQINGIKKAVKKANRKNAKFVDHNRVSNWVNGLGSKNERSMPK